MFVEEEKKYAVAQGKNGTYYVRAEKVATSPHLTLVTTLRTTQPYVVKTEDVTYLED